MSSKPPAISPGDSALFLDVDGTLLELQAHPDDVVADDVIVSLLHALQTDLNGAIALISGRTIEDVDRVFSPHRFPVAGEHGAMIRWPDGSVVNAGSDPVPDDVVQDARRFAASHEGLLLEQKSAGIALHYRQAPEMEESCRAYIESLGSDLGDGVRLLAGKMVFELTPCTTNKGAAVMTLLSKPPYENRTAIYVGDDVTDEDAFSVANRTKGMSIRVGDSHDTAARFTLADVSAVRNWLASAVERVAE